MNVNTIEWKLFLESLCRDLDIDICRQQSDLMALYITNLLAWNEKTNLTSITDPVKVAEKHILDSLIPGKYIQSISSDSEINLLDFGSGNGLPSIPLKISMPQLRITMVDSTRKKVSFLKYVIRVLQLDGITAISARIEQLAHKPDFSGKFDIVISRAFSSLDKFLNLAAPFIKATGHIIAMKGGNNLDKELDLMARNQIPLKKYQADHCQFNLKIIHYILPQSDSKRALIIAKKVN